MRYNPDIRHRRFIRLQGYDHSQAGAYFVTLCAQHRERLFGEIVNGEMRLNEAGEMVADEWIKSAEIRNEIELDQWVVMPNHFHGILVIAGGRGTAHRAPLVIRETTTEYVKEVWMVCNPHSNHSDQKVGRCG